LRDEVTDDRLAACCTLQTDLDDVTYDRAEDLEEVTDDRLAAASLLCTDLEDVAAERDDEREAE